MADSQRKKRKKRSKTKLSTGSHNKGHRQIKSSSRYDIDSSPSASHHSTNHNGNDRHHRLQHSLQHKPHRPPQPQHGRYATTNNMQRSSSNHNKNMSYADSYHLNNGSKQHRRSNTTKSHKPPKPRQHKRKTTPKNKIKSKNKKVHRYKSTEHIPYKPKHSNKNARKPPPRHTVSNPREFRHKFNMTEMQLVIGQIADMKKSWKTPDEEIMGRIYEIINMEERPHLNGKHCKVQLILDNENYRIALLGNGSEHVVECTNLKVAFETENLFLLWSSQHKPSKDFNRYSLHADGQPAPPKSPPPNQDIDDMYTIQAFETSFNETYEFRRYDFYCMACCICIGFLMSGIGVFLYMRHESEHDLHAIGAFAVVFAPVFGVIFGIYAGCLWYCCAVGKGKMDYYLGKNRFFGFECKECDCCKYQYFLVVALMGLFILMISIASYLLFDEYVQTDETVNDTQNTNPIKTDEDGQVSVNETRLFLAIEVVCGCAGIGLFISGIVVYYCCINRKVAIADDKGPSSPSIHADDDEYQE